jgi:hypothetical protein
VIVSTVSFLSASFLNQRHQWQFAAGIIDTGGKFATGVIDTSGNYWEQYQAAETLK